MILLLVSLLMLSGVLGQNEKPNTVVGERGGSVVLECSVTGTVKCELYKNNIPLLTQDIKNDRIKLLENGNCRIQITNLELTDDGDYRCHITNPSPTGILFKVIVTVTPEDPVLRYNNNPIVNGSKTPISPLTEGSNDTVTFHCISKGGHPKPNIHWTVDEVLIKDTSEDPNQDEATKLFNTDASLIYRFENLSSHDGTQKREKMVTCIVNHDSYVTEKTVWGVFAREYATSVVKIESNGDVLGTAEIKLSDGKEWHLICVSDGMPEANEFQWKVDDKEWGKGPLTYTVTKPGQYACRAKNVKSTDFVPSQTVKFAGSASDHVVPATLNFIFLLLVVLVLS